MTIEERVEDIFDGDEILWLGVDRARLSGRIKQAINAAVEEDRRERPHEFVGRSDRGCELCGAPDRDTIHCYSREVSRRFVERAVEEERERWVDVHDKYVQRLEAENAKLRHRLTDALHKETMERYLSK